MEQSLVNFGSNTRWSKLDENLSIWGNTGVVLTSTEIICKSCFVFRMQMEK